MKRLTPIILAVALALALGANSLTAQEGTTRIVFVDTQAAIYAHPAGQAARQLEERAREELGGITASLQELARKAQGGQALTPEEQERYQTLMISLDSVQQRYEAEIRQAAQPAVDAVNAVIRQLALDNGYTMVLDSVVAAESRLVVYAEDGADVTQLVLDRVQSGQ